MEAEFEVNKDFLKGFNHGYVLAEHEPQFAKMMNTAKQDNEYIIGFKAGRDEYGIEKMKVMIKDLPNSTDTPDKSKGMDKSK